MARVSLSIHGRRYDLACEDGAEPQLEALAGVVEARVSRIAAEGGPSDERLMLLAALMIADELSHAEARAAAAVHAAATLETDFANLEARALELIEGATRRIEALGGSLGRETAAAAPGLEAPAQAP